jgi:hypothetical protein
VSNVVKDLPADKVSDSLNVILPGREKEGKRENRLAKQEQQPKTLH